jgi:hypothetical protein
VAVDLFVPKIVQLQIESAERFGRWTAAGAVAG